MTLLDGAAPQSPLDQMSDPTVRPAHLDENFGIEAGARRPLAVPAVLDLVGVVAIAIGAALPLVLWGRVFADSGHVLPIVVASLGGALVALAAAVFRQSTPLSFVTLLIVLVVGLAARYNTAIAALPDDLIDSWKSLASTGLLIPTSRTFLVPPIVVTAAVSFAGASVILRRRSSVLVAVPLFLATAVALAYTVSLGSLPPWYMPAMVGIVGVALLIGGLRRPGGAEYVDGTSGFSLRQVVVGVAMVGLLAAGAGLVTSFVGDVGDDAFDLRSALVRPLDIYEAATPLASVKAGLVADVPNDVFTIRLESLPPDAEIFLLPVATLDAYDGSVWSTTAQFEPAGARLPSPEQAVSVGPGQVTQNIELTSAYPFRFLPRAGTIRNLAGDGLAWDPRSGTVASVETDASSYRGRIELAPLRPEQLPEPGEVPSSLRYASDRPETTDAQAEVFSAYAASVVTSESVEGRLADFESNLRSDAFGYNEEAPAGHSLAALASYLRPDVDSDDPGAAVPRIGFSEQSASAFAVLAREMGLASRVVVGYRLDEPLTAAAPNQTVNEGQIYAWPEVWFDGLGWVGFDPTNRANRSDDLSARTPAVSSSGQDAAQGQLPDFQEPVLLPPEGDLSSRSKLWWLLLLPLLPLAYAAIVIGAKRLRKTRRRRSADPNRQVVGAWREVRDRFGELGLPASSSSSALDLAEHLEVIDLRDLADPVTDLAPVIDDALYAPSPVSGEQAAQAWMLSRTAIKAAHRNAGMKQRLAAALDPRALFH